MLAMVADTGVARAEWRGGLNPGLDTWSHYTTIDMEDKRRRRRKPGGHSPRPRGDKEDDPGRLNKEEKKSNVNIRKKSITAIEKKSEQTVNGKKSSDVVSGNSIVAEKLGTQERIKALRQKYDSSTQKKNGEVREEEEEEYNSILLPEVELESSEVTQRLDHIDGELGPCIGELIQIQQDIEALKERFRKGEEDCSIVTLDNIYEKIIQREEAEEGRRRVEEDPWVNFRFAQIANERDIQHMVGGQEGRDYSIPGLVREDGEWRARQEGGRTGLEARAGEGWVRVKASWADQAGVSVGSASLLDTLGLDRSHLQPCIDRLKSPEGESLQTVGEVVVGLRVAGRRGIVLNRVVFIQGLRGLQLAWYTARELGLRRR